MIYLTHFDAPCLALVIASATVPCPAHSVDPPNRGPVTFEAIDEDGNGHVVPEQFAAHQALHHRQMMQRIRQP